ncbi:MAG: shikimate dehydrogenase [Saprospiraceae bacterium]|nr:shikimate dehydrogenase [Saprospiraceae bacterium]
MRKFGLIGYPLSHSFSKNFFAEKFNKEQIEGCTYELYPLENIEGLPGLLLNLGPELVGLNVTIPHKQVVIPYLDHLDEAAEEIGAVNTIHFSTLGTKGYNTDALGFEASLEQQLDEPVLRALVLGTGGASKAVQYVLKKRGIEFHLVSRQKSLNALTYEEINDELLQSCSLIINTTPLGMYPDLNACPPLRYEALGPDHILYDLIYNPAQTLFLSRGEARTCRTINGLDMLYRQAEASWSIWNS